MRKGVIERKTRREYESMRDTEIEREKGVGENKKGSGREAEWERENDRYIIIMFHPLYESWMQCLSTLTDHVPPSLLGDIPFLSICCPPRPRPASPSLSIHFPI